MFSHSMYNCCFLHIICDTLCDVIYLPCYPCILFIKNNEYLHHILSPMLAFLCKNLDYKPQSINIHHFVKIYQITINNKKNNLTSI